jgi:hypothetical protein
VSDYTVEVPFQEIGNRRGFTARQLLADPTAAHFYKQFKHCFEPAPWNIDAVLFIEPEAS